MTEEFKNAMEAEGYSLLTEIPGRGIVACASLCLPVGSATIWMNSNTKDVIVTEVQLKLR